MKSFGFCSLLSAGQRPLALVLVVCASLLAVGCGSSNDAATGAVDHDASTADSGKSEGGPLNEGGPVPDAGSDAFAVGPHAAFPQVPQNGGPVLAHPKLVTISFSDPSDAGAPDASTSSGGASAEQIAAFGDWIVTSPWLSLVGKDYGVGPGTHVHVTLIQTLSPAMSDDDVQALLASHIKDGSLPSDSTDAGLADGGSGEYLYEVFLPVTTVLSNPAGIGGGPNCVPYNGGFLGGYHWEAASPHIAYAVVPTCSSGSLVEGIGDIESAASHELIEASTDPFPDSTLGWAIIDPMSPWDFLDGEVADLCSAEEIQQGGFTVQRIWSNSAAASGGNPCIPAPAEPFYDATTTPSTVQNVLAGKTITFTVQGFSQAPVMPWAISAFSGGGTFDPKPTLSKSTLGNGETATLTLTVPSSAVSQDYALVFLDSSNSLTDYSFWPVAIEVP